MRKPKMILFDYGQTLVNEQKFDGVKGTKAVLKHAVRNKHNYTPEEVQAVADAIRVELGRGDITKRHLFQIEVPNHMFTAYLYGSLGIELSLTPQQIDRVFWDSASPGTPTDGIEDFLAFLKEQKIQTGVISNISYCGEVVQERISRLLPEHEFAFILATSEYIFRKPNRRIFELALEMADLKPEDVWYVGDSYACDVIGARNAGIFPVWYTGALDTVWDGETDALTVSRWEQLAQVILDA